MKQQKKKNRGAVLKAAGFLVLIVLIAVLFRNTRTDHSISSAESIPEASESTADSVNEVFSEASSVAEDITTEEPVSEETVPESSASDSEAAADPYPLGAPEYLSFYMDSAMGPMMYFNQADPRWGDYLWGGEDRLDEYGCGPVVTAMVANAFGNQQGAVNPIVMAEWCDANGQRAAHAGAYHSIVPTSLEAYGLTVESVTDNTNTEYVAELLRSEHVLVALVGPGYFTNNGHFIIIRGFNEDGSVGVADPANIENTNTSFALDFLLSQLKFSSTDAGGPLWSVSRPQQ